MGTSCSCNSFLELRDELDILKERKQNRDFFIDYNVDNINKKENDEFENKLKKISTNSMNSNNNDLGIFSTQSFSNIFKNSSIHQNDSYAKEILLKENINKEDIKEIINEKKKDKENEKDIIIENEKESGCSIRKEKKTQIQLRPKKILLKNINDIKEDDFKYNINISKTQLIYSCSSDIITKKKYENELISEEDYNLTPKDNYSKSIFRYINNLRINPKECAKLIKENKKYIIFDENNEIYFKKNKIKFSLIKGYQIFDETINILNNLEPMNKLIYNQRITIKIPYKNNDIIGLDYMKNQIEDIQNRGNHIFSYWKEKIKDPEIAFLMMVVDDNNQEPGLKRKDLINPDIIYIGISSVEYNNEFACFITLSNRK